MTDEESKNLQVEDSIKMCNANHLRSIYRLVDVRYYDIFPKKVRKYKYEKPEESSDNIIIEILCMIGIVALWFIAFWIVFSYIDVIQHNITDMAYRTWNFFKLISY